MKTETTARNYRPEKEATYSPEEAAAIEYFGPEFATLNFPPDGSDNTPKKLRAPLPSHGGRA